jgi:hypothetical protein
VLLEAERRRRVGAAIEDKRRIVTARTKMDIDEVAQNGGECGHPFTYNLIFRRLPRSLDFVMAPKKKASLELM